MKKRNVWLVSLGMAATLALSACNQNAAEPDNNQVQNKTRTGVQQVGYGTFNTNNNDRKSLTVPTDGLQKVNNGFLTIDQNSYSTTIPSTHFPHSKYVEQGQFRFYTDRQSIRQGNQRSTLQNPGAGQETPNTQQTPQQSSTQQTPQQQSPAQETAPEQKIETKAISETESRVIELTNAERRKNGLPNLQADTSLSNVAREKTNDMQKNNYFSHTSPTYGSPFDMMRDFGIKYKTAGENIAQGQQTPEQVVNAWMNSEGHRKNILSKDYTHIGVGHNSNGNYWSQMFVGR
jgi:uncharacterized YkwD family protein